MTDVLTPLKLYKLGYPVLPSGGGPAGKSPLVDWTIYQEQVPDENDIQIWQSKFNPRLWGITTGHLADVVVIDIDKPELRSIFDDCGLLPHIQTPRGGYHYWFRYPGHHVKTVAGVLSSVDVRGDGGFVNVIGSRADGKYTCLIVPTPEAVYPWEKLPASVSEAITRGSRESKPTLPLSTPDIIPEGQRNDTLTREAGKLRRAGFAESTIYAALQDINNTRCNPPLRDNEIASIAKSVCRYLPGNFNSPLTGNVNKSIYNLPEKDMPESERNDSVTKSVTKEGLGSNGVTKAQIEEWVKTTTGWFSYEDIDHEFGIRTPNDKTNRRMAIMRLKEDGVIESHPLDNKKYRFVNVKVRLIDFKSSTRKTPLSIKLPFNIEKYAAIYPGNIIVLAGAANAGKTAFLLNTIRENMYDFSFYYQSSEMGQDELAVRLEKFEGISLNDWNFTAEERSSNFADVIRPDCVNIIDYMELSTDCFMVAEYLKQIHEKLASGIAIVALQKKIGADMGRGGEFGLEKPRLYLSMDAGKLKITKAKNWANPDINPNKLCLNFKIAAGCRFIPDYQGWHKEDEQ